jgi:hypothetical protein
MHRLAVAKIKGYKEIEAIFFEGDQQEAFLLAVQANTQHGLPLSLADRKAAAARLVESNPEMSDRAIAGWAGLAAKTVARIRRATETLPQPDTRIGHDGRKRPLDARDGRRRAAEFLAANPQASLRKIAQAAQVSVGTARDVRERVQRGEDPVAPKDSGGREHGSDPCSDSVDVPSEEPAENSSTMIAEALHRMEKDPSLRFSEAGRSLLRWLHQNAAGILGRPAILDAIPPHQRDAVITIARQCAQEWIQFSREVERQSHLEKTPPGEDGDKSQ